ncbi:hypothetical protein PGT21_019445 [Puccinia graminis f. sp. tritici]|uniref:Uncharacterized protein n=1 Tax=Puccinia graminis f. sp. tritici TaxID=56615 RepID=A0A5B0M8W1_PUCGR|nr:hypothetical protein PGT21_019445 [Puccinia graminis f. sp. tritici]
MAGFDRSSGGVPTPPNDWSTKATGIQPLNPSAMGQVELNASMWQQPGIIIGVGCPALKFLYYWAGISPLQAGRQCIDRSAVCGLSLALTSTAEAKTTTRPITSGTQVRLVWKQLMRARRPASSTKAC